LRAENARLLAERDEIRGTVSHLTSQVDAAERLLAELGGRLLGEGSPAFADLEHEKERLSRSLAQLRSRVAVQDQTAAAAAELQARLRHISRQYRIVKRAVDGMPRPEEYPDGDEVAELEAALRSARQETTLLREQVRQLQAQVAAHEGAAARNERILESRAEKIRVAKAALADAAREAAREQSEIAELRALYRQATEAADRADRAHCEAAEQLRRGRKEAKKTGDENEELKMLLERANAEAKRHMDDNVVLVRRLRRAEPPQRDGRDEEIATLRTQLREALKLIKRLQMQITEFRNRQQTECIAERNHQKRRRAALRVETTQQRPGRTVARARTRSPSPPTESGSVEEEIGDDQSLTKPSLEALDAAIHQLEVTIHRSRKESGLSVSSE
jgi:chromosome segregation ATPase